MKNTEIKALKDSSKETLFSFDVAFALFDVLSLLVRRILMCTDIKHHDKETSIFGGFQLGC